MGRLSDIICDTADGASNINADVDDENNAGTKMNALSLAG
jgi:hypothetical protein